MAVMLAASFSVVFCKVSVASVLYLKSGVIDTSTTTFRTLTQAPDYGFGAGYYLVALKGPILPDQKARIEAAGAQIVDYIPDFAYLV
ncbi:MAG: hypothetical protein N3B12_09470, partial [Armatimonadetes bacterium]|nr:hypothetical protein [Armatimonadota bacterium]